MTSYVTRMPQGVPGDISRQSIATIESQPKNTSLTFPSFGVPGKMAAGKFVPIAAVNDVVYGLLVRPFPTQGVNASDPLGTSVPDTTALPGNIMRRGYMTVKNNNGAPASNGQVFVRVANGGVGTPVGGVEATYVASSVGAANGGNTGNGTISAAPVLTSGAQSGVATVTMLSATTFTVSQPDGSALANGKTGVAYTAGGMTFTVTAGGTPMVAGDFFTVTNTLQTQAIPGATFMSAADASGNVEIAYNI